MGLGKLRKLWYGFLLVYGLAAAVAPRTVARLAVRVGLPGFENTGELAPTDWYARGVRASGVGMLAAGGTGLLLEARAEEAAAGDEDDAAADAPDVTVASTGDETTDEA